MLPGSSDTGCDDVVGPDGMEKFCEDIGVEPENVSVVSVCCRSEPDAIRSDTASALCPGGDAGSGVEAGRPEHGLLHPAGVAERHGLAAVRRAAALPPAADLRSQRVTPLCSAVVRCDSTERLRNSLDYLRSVLNDSTSFKLIYRYAFDFARVSRATALAHGRVT